MQTLGGFDSLGVLLRKLLIVAAGALLAGCVSDGGQVDQRLAAQQPPTKKVRQMVVNEARNILLDPYSVRDVSISSLLPNLNTPEKGDGFICIRYNAKNGYGGYTGIATVGTNVIKGQLIGLYRNPYMCAYPALKWHPLPEASQLRNL